MHPRGGGTEGTARALRALTLNEELATALLPQALIDEVKGNRLKNRNRPGSAPAQSSAVDQRRSRPGHPKNGAIAGTQRPFSLRGRPMWLWSGILLLALLHHDFWFWDDARLVLGFIPAGMAYHIVYSVLASLFWLIAIRRAWPDELENWTDDTPATEGRRIR